MDVFMVMKRQLSSVGGGFELDDWYMFNTWFIHRYKVNGVLWRRSIKHPPSVSSILGLTYLP